MIVRTFADAPPSSRSAQGSNPSRTITNPFSRPDSLPSTVCPSEKNEILPPPALGTSDDVSRIPRVSLDVNSITDVMAAQLATSLVGHVLFLKNQVPFPVMQLARIPGSQSNARVSKKRNELLSSFDTLSSHLVTTFTALSTALARPVPRNSHTNAEGGVNGQEPAPQKGRAYLGVLVGPGLGSAKAKIIFAVDGLEVKVWGAGDDVDMPKVIHSESEEEEENATDSGSDSESAESGSEDGSEPATGSEDEDSDESSSHGSPMSQSSTFNPPHPMSTPPRSAANGHCARSPVGVDEQQSLRAAERLFSRTLALADGEGHSMACELAPTQTHILLRAPRWFKHPAWVPRQNLTSSLDNVLQEFLEEANVVAPPNEQKKKKQTCSRVEGVWIACRGEELGNIKESSQVNRVSLAQDPWEDEMIWWSWDGKLVGFADW